MYLRLTEENKENPGGENYTTIVYVPTYVVFNHYTVLIEMLVVTVFCFFFIILIVLCFVSRCKFERKKFHVYLSFIWYINTESVVCVLCGSLL